MVRENCSWQVWGLPSFMELVLLLCFTFWKLSLPGKD